MENNTDKKEKKEKLEKVGENYKHAIKALADIPRKEEMNATTNLVMGLWVLSLVIIGGLGFLALKVIHL